MNESTRKRIGASLVIITSALFVVGALTVPFKPHFFRYTMTLGYACLGALTWLSGNLGRWQKILIGICAFNVLLYVGELIWRF